MNEIELQTLRAVRAMVDALLGENLSGGVDVADDRDLDSKWGDPEVKFHPRDWRGVPCKGLKMSQCPAEFLDMLAGTFDYFAKQAEKNNETTAAGKPVAQYKRKDAARARGWAKRIRGGWKSADGEASGGSSFGSFEGGGFEDEPAAEEVPF